MADHLKAVNRESSEHYILGDACDGWHLLKREDVNVIQERVPPGKSETTRFHKLSRQFFYVLEGEAAIATDSQRIILKKHQSIEIPPGVPHQLRNESDADVSFLVISVPKSHGDRYDVGAKNRFLWCVCSGRILCKAGWIESSCINRGVDKHNRALISGTQQPTTLRLV